MLTLDREGPDVQLAEQLDDIRNKLVGMPLKVEFKVIDPAKADAKGILGYIDQAKAQIARLQEAESDALKALDRARDRRQALGEEVPSPFVLTEKQLLGRIDERLDKATSDLQKGVFLRVVKRTDQVLQDLETVGAFLAAMEAHGRCRSEIDAAVEQGYRQERLETDRNESETDIKAVAEQFAAGNYDEAVPWLAELEGDGQRALETLKAWQEKQSQNAEALEQFCGWTERVETYRTGEVHSAWQTLQAYPKGNWTEAAEEMEQATRSLARLRGEVVAQVERLNSIEGQDFVEAERLLAQAAADLTQAEGQFQAVVNCLAEVQVAETNIDQALAQAEEELVKAEAFRDQEDVKVGPEVDQEIGHAREQLARAQQLSQAREFVQATEAHTEAMRLATAAYAAASQQVLEIDELQTELERMARSVAGKVGQCKSRVKEVPAAAKRAETQKQVQRAIDALVAAKQKRASVAGLEDQTLVTALRAAVAAYEEARSRADQALAQVKADVDEHKERLEDAKQAVRTARATIRRVQQKVSRAAGRGRLLLEKARGALPGMPTGNESRQVLADIWKRAMEAVAYAKRAEACIPAPEPKRSTRSRTVNVPSTYAPSRRSGSSRTSASRSSAGRSSSSRTRSSRSSTSSRTSTRSSSRSTSTRTRSTGTSRRPSSTGTSRRSSSSGSSRRSSSSGSSRRSRSTGSSRRR
jgi:chromosome segregation ATPase